MDNGLCLLSCPLGKQNVGGFCLRCLDGVCPNALNEFFDVRKVAPNVIEVTQLKEVNGLAAPLSSNFVQEVVGAALVSDYNLKVEDFPEQYKFRYTYDFRDGLDRTGKFVNVDLLNAPLSDLNGNALATHRWSFPVDLSSRLFENPSITSPLIAAAVIAPAVVAPAVVAAAIPAKKEEINYRYNPIGRKEHRNTSVEYSFKVWAVFSFLWFIIAMVAGMIGLCCCYCPHLEGKRTDWWDFFYQKLLQTFLMGQMLAFHALYNCYFPYNLLNYLHHIFKYIVAWHRRVFDGRAWGTHHSKSFRDNWLNHENRRFYEEKVYNHFTIQFGFVLLFQLFFLFLFGLIKLAYLLFSKKVQPATFNNLSIA